MTPEIINHATADGANTWMYLVENPVLQRELLVNLRTVRSFVLLFLFHVLLAGVVYAAWPQVERWDPEGNRAEAQKLFNLFFLGQFILASMMAPSFAAGALTGEKERKTYEMLLASPLKPGAIVIGKLMASLAHLALLIFTSLPIVLLCLPLGGVSLYEVIAAYFLLMVAVATFGMISVACSSYFQRTASSLVVSYLVILPIALVGAMFWQSFQGSGATRLAVLLAFVPLCSVAICGILFVITGRRLLYPPDVGSEGGEVVDLDKEAEEAVGLVIQRDQFPDRLFAPPKRTKLLEDNANPVYEKEIHSEIFAQGTLMLRVVIQVSMVLAIPLMAICLYIWPHNAPYYISYVVLFNMLVGPVFSAGSITSERERQTLDLLLTTEISPWQILSGKLLAGLRVSTVLTGFLLWPLLLACVMVTHYWENFTSVLGYLVIIALTCFTSSMLALFASVNFRKTAHSLMTTYLVIIALFAGPLAFAYFADLAFGHTPLDAPAEVIATNAAIVNWADRLTIMSPFAATWNVPMSFQAGDQSQSIVGSWIKFGYYAAFTTLLNLTLFCSMTWLFNRRWRVAE
ncbi:ABC transporter permease subunit [Blastopirellula sp. J2-11]|uniref:ABC transporter permease n=1 Tax=Blastopirellula sp. J2-11 TaxID=2943192 RepID=UPI0021CA858E|nr:ABC transporter permease subunit [Blastopirellula sp. J2-11]UUO08326.1 ABC transporter permease subunit [Blastopirellula sp. J2-11]